jgi:FtsP/CotA-like multicopper oxidase with cupredoxin domain
MAGAPHAEVFMPSRPILSRRLFLGQSLVSLLALPARPALAENPAATGNFQVLEAGDASLRLLPEPAEATAVWGYNGAVPGPLLRLKTGEEARIRLVNKLSQPTTLSWHSLRVPNAMAGVAGLTQEAVPPGASFDYRFTPREPGLSWYHPHVLEHIGEQIGRGLHGVVIVDEAEPPAIDKDLLLLIADWKLGETGAIDGDFASLSEARGKGRIGQLVTLNSEPVPVPRIMPPGSRLRLRIVSAVTARIMLLTFNGLRPLVLAVDGQPCEAFEPVRQTIPIGPGARFDIMVDLPPEPGAEADVTLRGVGEEDRVLLTLKTSGAKRDPLPPIGSLAQNPLLPPVIRLEKARKIDLVFEPNGGATKTASPGEHPVAWAINGTAKAGFPAKPLFSVKRGTPVSLGFVNRTGQVQQVRVHGHCVRLLHDLDDGWEPYWRDAVLVPEGRTKRVAFVADNPGKWPIECLVAARQASGLATWFEVT